MSAPTAQDRLEIEVENFGPIVHAKVDLRPMTVFIGPSNTGKSYLAMLIYALHRFFGDSSGGQFPGFHRFESVLLGTEYTIPRGLPEETVATFERLAQYASNASAGLDGGSITLPDGIVESVGEQFGRLAGAACYEVMRSFGMNGTAPLIRKGSKAPASVVIQQSQSNKANVLEHKLLLNPREANLQTSIPRQITIAASNTDQNELYYSAHDFRRVANASGPDSGVFGYMSAIISLMGLAAPEMVGALRSPAFYLPTDRAGVINTHGALVAAMLSNVPMAGSQPTGRTPMISGILADFLRQLIQIDQVQNPMINDKHDASERIEKNILHGSIGVERSELINYPHFTYRPNGWKEDLPLMHASSMVSELAPVVLYLRHLVRPGNVLIIEEPESHLHPAAQVEFTRQLAKLVQQGYRVIITTHSEWILEELANVVQRSQLPPEELSTISESDAALTADQVGVWLFRQKARPRGSEVVHVPLGDSGLYDSGFDDVAIALSNDGANIFNRIGKNE